MYKTTEKGIIFFPPADNTRPIESKKEALPVHIRSDNVPEFIARILRKWLEELGVKTLFIEPGRPWDVDPPCYARRNPTLGSVTVVLDSGRKMLSQQRYSSPKETCPLAKSARTCTASPRRISAIAQHPRRGYRVKGRSLSLGRQAVIVPTWLNG